MVFCNSSFQDYHNAEEDGHNPYFNRWFSAMHLEAIIEYLGYLSQSLF